MDDQQDPNEAADGRSDLTAVLAACPSEGNFSEQQTELYELMSEISEDCYYAGWMMGLEYAVWGALQDGDLRYGMGEMDAASLMRCRVLSLTLGGWIVWVDDDTDSTLTHEHWGPRFVPMDVWVRMVEAANAKLSRGGTELNGTGFVVCEFPPDEDPCECCGKTNVQHYWRQSDPLTQDGRYHCAECVIAEHEANQETDAFDYKHEASNV